MDFRNTNSLWCSVLVEALVRCGLRHAVISPGSRSTPLTLALVRHPAIAATPVVDERSAAFFALGLAKCTHAPVALLCTSGTAGANYFPAIIEAHESGTPLLVLTADRPPELRDCASGQTIDQLKLFGGYATFFHECAVPEAKLELLAYARQTIAQAYGRALFPVPGPVHLNLPFRDPLPPISEEDPSTRANLAALREHLDESFFAHLQPPARNTAGTVARQRPTTTRGLIVAGPANPADAAHYVARVQAFAVGLGWPILADALSPLRHAGGTGVPVVAHYDAILRDERRARELVPRTVFCLEGWPTSKVLRAWLEQSQAEVVLVAETAANRDALHGRTRHVPLAATCLEAAGTSAGDDSFAAAWRVAEADARALLEAAFTDTSELFEGKAAWLLGQHLPEGTPVFVASSMPVRDVEYFWPPAAQGTAFFFNRGANGIDGTLSTALGIAHASPRPAVLLTGDLAFLHDSNGLMLASKLHGSLTVILINNQGGGIFEHLPVAQFDPPFEAFFATPPQVDFASLCAAHGVAYQAVLEWTQFIDLVTALPSSGVRVLELRTDRKRDAATRRRLLSALSRTPHETSHAPLRCPDPGGATHSPG